MAFNTVNINQKNSTSGRQATGFDHYSTLICYGTAPVVSGKWTTYPGPPEIKAQQMFSKTDATDAGIIEYTDNTAPTATFIISALGATGNTGEIKVTVPKVNSTTDEVSLGLYTVTALQTTIDLQGAAWAAVINNNTSVHGWTASFNAANDTMTLTAPKTVGVSLNTGTPYAITVTGTLAYTTLTQKVVTGTASHYALWQYHIEEFFRNFSTGNLWVVILPASSSFDEVSVAQLVSGNKVRQMGIYDVDATRGAAANILGTLTSLDVACDVLEKKSPFIAVYSPNIAAVTDLSTYPNQNSNTAKRVQCVISQDGDAKGALHFVRNGISVGNIGAKLASIAKSRVSASDAQPNETFNMSDGVENNLPAFANGVLASNVAESLQVQLHDYRYTFFVQYGDEVVGSYWSDNKTCVASTSSFCFVNDNRVYDKISRILYSTFIPKLSSELIFNTDGTLKDYVIEDWTNLGEDAVNNNMVTGYGTAPLISGFQLTIDPTQKVQSTNNFTLDCGYIQNGIARNITINLGPVTSF